jgi:glycosyltransferase involved in cell wall biosynthesis
MSVPSVVHRPYASTHVGSSPEDLGGIAAVLAAYLHLPPEQHCVTAVPSYRSSARLWSVSWYLRALVRLLRTPKQQLGIVHAHLSRRGSFVREGSLLVVAHLRGCPTCATIHGSCFGVNFRRYRPLYVSVLRRADRVVILTDETADLLRPHLGSRRLVTVDNPVEMAAQPTPAAAAGRVALFAGQLSERKGLDVLLAAWKLVQRQVADAELLVAGPRCDVDLPADPSVTYLGPVRRDVVPALLEQARVAVLPSRHEAMPVFLLEAMAAARPVVSTDVAAIPSIVGDAGIIVRVGDVAGLADAIVRLLLDPDLADRLGRLGRTQVAERHGLEAVSAALGRIYEDVLRDHCALVPS